MFGEVISANSLRTRSLGFHSSGSKRRNLHFSFERPISEASDESTSATQTQTPCGEASVQTATPDQGAHEVADERVGEPRRHPSLEASLAIAIDAGTLPSRELALAEEVPFEEPVSLVRGRSGIGLGAGSSGGDGPRKKQGLNPRMMAKNQYLHDAKTAAGRNLTEAELQEHAAMFQRLWESGHRFI